MVNKNINIETIKYQMGSLLFKFNFSFFLKKVSNLCMHHLKEYFLNESSRKPKSISLIKSNKYYGAQSWGLSEEWLQDGSYSIRMLAEWFPMQNSLHADEVVYYFAIESFKSVLWHELNTSEEYDILKSWVNKSQKRKKDFPFINDLMISEESIIELIRMFVANVIKNNIEISKNLLLNTIKTNQFGYIDECFLISKNEKYDNFLRNTFFEISESWGQFCRNIKDSRECFDAWYSVHSLSEVNALLFGLKNKNIVNSFQISEDKIKLLKNQEMQDKKYLFSVLDKSKKSILDLFDNFRQFDDDCVVSLFFKSDASLNKTFDLDSFKRIGYSENHIRNFIFLLINLLREGGGLLLQVNSNKLSFLPKKWQSNPWLKIKYIYGFLVSANDFIPLNKSDLEQLVSPKLSKNVSAEEIEYKTFKRKK